jgi:hypothetical protein
MAVTKLDITLPARAARHLYLTTGIVFFIVSSWLSVYLFEFTIPVDAGLVVLAAGIFAALYYARRELNGLAYAVAALLAALLLALGCSVLFVGITSFQESTSGPEYAGAVFTMLVSGPIVVYFIRVLIDYGRLFLSLRTASNDGALGVANEVSRLFGSTRGTVPALHWPTDPFQTVLYAILFVLSLPAASLITSVVRVPFIALFLPVAAAEMTRRHYVMRADRLIELDTRHPILFLRSFRSDKVRLWGKGVLGKLRGPTIDAAITPFARRLGPFVAIANPDEKLPRLGAAQTHYSNDTWQNAIARWVGMAQMIVMVAGRTEGLRWEIEHILANEKHPKLVIVFPPALREDDAAAARWLSEHFSDTRYGPDLSAIAPKGITALVFRENGLFAVEARRVRVHEADYLVAFQAIVYAMAGDLRPHRITAAPQPSGSAAGVLDENA